MEKDKDLFLDMLENPNLTLEDMVSVGHSAESTRFLDKSAYENSQKVRAKFTDAEGNFKQDEFDTWYNTAANAYLQITDKDNNLSLLKVTAFDESDITVSPEKRTLNTKPIISLMPNPDRLSTSIYQIGKTSERERTQSELALAEKILLNPVEAAQDPSKAKWGDSPNDSWWGNFFDTQVLAQWDEDGTHVDPVTGLTIHHLKGELKLNDNGTYYYESLDGRDIYGRQVLNKMNTITTDGSFWNQYDFFDSDDIKEKSFVGSVAKNLALVGSMFIPYVGWGIAGASVGTLLIGLTGTLGKMLTGSDSPTFSAMEGWAKSLDRQSAKSEYALQNMLCWENFIDLIGDTTALLRELRAIFKFAPAILGKGKYGIQSEAFGANTKVMKEAEMAALRKESTSNLDISKMMRAVGGDNPRAALERAGATQNSIISNIADKSVKDYLESYNSLGEKIARAYMVGITVGDTYGEAKEAGASDFEATMLTLGYAAAENKLLNSELGRWIFPELKGQNATNRLIVKRMLEPSKELSAEGLESTLNASGVKKVKSELISKKIANMGLDTSKIAENLGSVSLSTKAAWMKKWFNAGKEIFDTLQSVMKGTVGAMVSNALAEGTEEVSEELLKDFSTSCFNLVKAAQGSDVRMLGFLGTWDWNEALKRYGMSFFGGLVGGGINSAATDYRQFRDIANMTSELAMQLLVWMERNGEMDKFWDSVSKMTLGDKQHTTERDENGNFKLGDKDNNLDVEVKKAIRQLLDLIHNILTVNGANVNDDGLIGQVMNSLPSTNSRDVLGDFRANALATSVTAGRFLKEYNNLCKAIVLEANNLRNLQRQNVDSQKPTPDQEQAIKESQEALQTLQEAKQNLTSGKRTAEFYKDAMFETTYGVSESFITPTEVLYMEMITGKPYSLITEEERRPLRDRYANWSRTERAEQIHQLATIFYDTTTKTSQALLLSHEMYEKQVQGLLKKLLDITDFSAERLLDMRRAMAYYGEDALEAILNILTNTSMNSEKIQSTPVAFDLNGNLGDTLLSDVQDALGNEDSTYSTRYKEILEDTNLTLDEKVPLLATLFTEEFAPQLEKTAQEIIDTGYINPEVKRTLLPTLQQTIANCRSLWDAIDALSDIIADSLSDKYADALEKVESIQNSLEEKVEKLQNLGYTPISENLRNFAIGIGTNKSVLDLVEAAIKKEESYLEAVDNIIIDDETALQFKAAEQLLKLYRASIVASRVDNADVDHIFGYNKALNELCGKSEGWVPLAEIDGQVADLAIQDVTMALNRLLAIKEISDLNQGNKLNVQNYTAANKNYIVYNKMNKLVTSLLNEDDDDAKNVRLNWTGIDKLKTVLDSMITHKELSAEKLENRVLSLNSAQKEAIERELHALDDAIYEFFQENKDKVSNTAMAKNELAKFLKATKMDYYDKNEGILTLASETIDDGAFTWWLASKAALKGSEFYNVYRKIISDDIAPIPTQELGVYAATAAIYNGDVFRAFGEAMKQYMYEDWSSIPGAKLGKDGKTDKSTINCRRSEIIKQKGLQGLLPLEEDNNSEILFSDLVPNFNNILFIEGIPGSGKSTGVLKTLVALLNSLNPDLGDGTKLFDRPVVVAHSTKENAEHLAQDVNFKDGTRVVTHDKEGLLSWMSAEYKDCLNPTTGLYEYTKKDVVLNNEGVYVCTWKTRKLPKSEVPGVIFIDEWSRFTLPEIALVNKFAAENGIQVIACGDLDLLSPTAYYCPKKDMKPADVGSVCLSNARNITPRVPKLGISMRAGNGQKVQNLYALQAWKQHPTEEAIELFYVEDKKDLWGDKPYQIGTSGDLTDKLLTELKTDIDKMIANLKEGEKIGYIWSDPNSKLYKLLDSEPYKDKIEFKNETAALGREAKYYIVENSRNPRQSDLDYHKSLYTGISRAEQASIVLVPDQAIGRLRVRRPLKLENKLIPDNFTKEGIARFAVQRRNLLNLIYGDRADSNLTNISPRVLVMTSETADTTKKPKPKKDKPDPPKSAPAAQFQKNLVLSNSAGNIIKILDVATDMSANPPVVLYKVDLDGSGAKFIPELDLLNQGYLIFKEKAEDSQANTLTTTTQPSTLTTTTQSVPREGELIFEEQPETLIVPEGKVATTEGTSETIERDEPPVDTLWKLSAEDQVKKFFEGMAGVAAPFDADYVQFSQLALENYLGINKGDLDNLIAYTLEFDREDFDFSELSPGVYKVKKSDLLKQLGIVELIIPQGATTVLSPTPSYSLGDVFKKLFNGLDYRITEVSNNPESGITYKLEPVSGDTTKTISRPENALKQFEDSGLFIAKEDYVTPDEGVRQLPELPEATLGRDNLLQVIEEIQETLEDPTEELVITDDDIDVPILGHTWNTYYLGVEFDEQSGQPILPQNGEPGSARIDCAHGLVKLNPDKFNSKEAIKKTMGRLRKSMLFKDNSRIIRDLQEEIPALLNLNLTIDWFFISKTGTTNKDRGVFTYSDTGLEHMEDSLHEHIPTKMISLLVKDATGKCVLELPLFNLGSPFTILYKLSEQSPNNSIAIAYKNASTNHSLKPFLVLQKVVEAIANAPEAKNTAGGIKPGYTRLANLCKLWLFSSDGIRKIPNVNKSATNPEGEPWYPAFYKKCLGPHYVKDRVTELSIINGGAHSYDYSMVWHDLTAEGRRTDVNYSDVMISLEDTDPWGHKVVAPGHPYVLRSDSDEFVTNEAMMQRYLQQLDNPSLEPIVKLEILAPPETSVYDYIDRMRNGLGNRYGNEFTAFRILNIVKNLDPKFWQDSLSMKTRGAIESIMELLNNVQQNLQKEAGENHQEYMSRVYRALKEIMVNSKAIKDFQDALFEMTYDYNGSDDNLRHISEDAAQHVQYLCDLNDSNGNKYITGVLYRPICRAAADSEPVLGYGYLVKTGHNRFTNEDGKSYRIYSRYDTPIFDLTDLESAIAEWANNYTVNGIVYRFTNPPGKADEAYKFYTSNGVGKAPVVETPNLKLLKKHKDLLANLGINDYSRLTSIEDETRFLQAIGNLYAETPGNVATVVNGNKLIYAQINNEGVGALKFTEDLLGATQLSFESNLAGDNTYTLKLQLKNGDITELLVTILPETNEIEFDLGVAEQAISAIELNPIGYDYAPVLEHLNQRILDLKLEAVTHENKKVLKDQLEKVSDIIQKGITDEKSHTEIVQLILEAYPKRLTLRMLMKEIGENFFNTDEDSGQEKLQLETEVCSIKVRKKFRK